VLSISDYYDDSSAPAKSVRKAAGASRYGNLKYPALYPPHAVDELKE
jgi:hypothetical protein